MTPSDPTKAQHAGFSESLDYVTIRIGAHTHVAADPLTESARLILDATSHSAPTH